MTLPPPVGRRLPPPVWPLWIVVGVLLLVAPITVSSLDAIAGTSREHAARERDAADRSAVVVGALVDTGTTSGLPKETPIYLLRLPARAGLPARTMRAAGPSTWGFPPSVDHAPQREFLVVIDQQPRVIADGAVGTLRAPTLESAAREETRAQRDARNVTAGRIVLPVALLGVSATAIVLGLCRAQAVRAHRRSRFVDPTWWAPPRDG